MRARVGTRGDGGGAGASPRRVRGKRDEGRRGTPKLEPRRQLDGGRRDAAAAIDRHLDGDSDGGPRPATSCGRGVEAGVEDRRLLAPGGVDQRRGSAAGRQHRAGGDRRRGPRPARPRDLRRSGAARTPGRVGGRRQLGEVRARLRCPAAPRAPPPGTRGRPRRPRRAGRRSRAPGRGSSGRRPRGTKKRLASGSAATASTAIVESSASARRIVSCAAPGWPSRSSATASPTYPSTRSCVRASGSSSRKDAGPGNRRRGGDRVPVGGLRGAEVAVGHQHLAEVGVDGRGLRAGGDRRTVGRGGLREAPLVRSLDRRRKPAGRRLAAPLRRGAEAGASPERAAAVRALRRLPRLRRPSRPRRLRGAAERQSERQRRAAHRISV